MKMSKRKLSGFVLVAALIGVLAGCVYYLDGVADVTPVPPVAAQLAAPDNVLITNATGPAGQRTVAWDAVEGATGYLIVLYQTQDWAQADTNRAAWLTVGADVTSVNLKQAVNWEGPQTRDPARQAQFAQLSHLERTGHTGWQNQFLLEGNDVSENLVHPNNNLRPGTYFVRIQALGPNPSPLSGLGYGSPTNAGGANSSNFRGMVTSLPIPMGPWEAKVTVEEFIVNFGVEALLDPTLIPGYIAPSAENNWMGDPRELVLTYILPPQNVMGGVIRFWNEAERYGWGMGLSAEQAYPDPIPPSLPYGVMTHQEVWDLIPNRNATILAL
ncbi:MAG: hypothetical protein FWB74_03675 [Defluviitaleaceae bacterium]|nr:hypothetical protein [Defluviitaleaceae bacterium]